MIFLERINWVSQAKLKKGNASLLEKRGPKHRALGHSWTDWERLDMKGKLRALNETSVEEYKWINGKSILRFIDFRR